MKIFEVTGTQFDPLLVEFWRQAGPEQLRHYFIQDNCIDASNDFLEFLETQKRIGVAEVVPIGHMVNGQKKRGWIRVDAPVYDADAVTPQEALAMKKLKLNPAKPQDIQKFAEANGLQEEFQWIPHSWVEIRGNILDPSGFYLDGTSGQFDRLVQNKANVAGRYQYF